MCVTRWPANTALPRWPGIAEPGQWPGPWSTTVSQTPSKIGCTRPIFGIVIVPICDDRHVGVGVAAARRIGHRERLRSWSSAWPSSMVVDAVVVVGAGATERASAGSSRRDDERGRADPDRDERRRSRPATNVRLPAQLGSRRLTSVIRSGGEAQRPSSRGLARRRRRPPAGARSPRWPGSGPSGRDPSRCRPRSHRARAGPGSAPCSKPGHRAADAGSTNTPSSEASSR